MAPASDALSLGLPSKAEKESVRQADETPIEETNPKVFVNHKIKKRSEDACEPDCDCPSGFEGIVPFCRPVGAVDACDPDCECPPGFVGIAPFCRAGTAAESIKVKRQKKTYLSSVGNRQKNPIDYPDSCEPDCDCPPGFEGVVPFCRPVTAADSALGENNQKDPDDYYVDDCRPNCECPPGFEGVQPFCYPVADINTGLVRRSIGYPKPPSCYERPCTSHLDCEDCDLACWNDIGRCNEWAKLLSSP